MAEEGGVGAVDDGEWEVRRGGTGAETCTYVEENSSEGGGVGVDTVGV